MPKNKPKLKSCPFCGSDNIHLDATDQIENALMNNVKIVRYRWFQCWNCCVRTGWHKSRSAAIRA